MLASLPYQVAKTTVNSMMVGLSVTCIWLLLFYRGSLRLESIAVTFSIAVIIATLKLWLFPKIGSHQQLDKFSFAMWLTCMVGTLITTALAPETVSGIEGLIVLTAIAALIFFKSYLFFTTLVFSILGLILVRHWSGLPLNSFEWLQTLVIVPWLGIVLRFSAIRSLQQAIRYSFEQETIVGTLNSQQEQLTAILERSPLVLCVMDSDGVYIQSRGCGLAALGLKQNEIVDLPYTQVFSPYPEVIDAVSKAKAGGRAEVRAKFGPATFFDIIYEPVKNERDEITGIIGVGIDVSHRVEMERKEKELERQIYQSQKDESISTLAGGIAHDFNNYLMSIVGFCESIQNELPKENRSETIGLIKKTAIRAAGVSKQMLVYASNDRDTHATNTPIDLNNFFEECSDLLVAIVPKKIKLATPTRSDAPMPVLADDVLLQQVILNLLRNAIDAIGDTVLGEIKISCCNPADSLSEEYFVKGKLNDQTDYCEIRITDTGCGIPSDKIATVFDLYYSTKMTGHGIGLAVTSSIIQNHGGIIACKSDKGIGTEIKILLPVAATSEPEQKQQSKSNEMQLAEKCVLVIDDEPTVLMSIAMMLESRGCKVHQAESGSDALEKLPSICNELDCIILDYTMPKMNGLQVLEQIRQSDIAVPVIMCSGLPLNQIQHDGNFWPDDILNKPFQLQELCEKISNICKTKS